MKLCYTEKQGYSQQHAGTSTRKRHQRKQETALLTSRNSVCLVSVQPNHTHTTHTTRVVSHHGTITNRYHDRPTCNTEPPKPSKTTAKFIQILQFRNRDQTSIQGCTCMHPVIRSAGTSYLHPHTPRHRLIHCVIDSETMMTPIHGLLFSPCPRPCK